MTHTSAPALAELPTEGGLAEILFDRAERSPDRVMLSRQVDGEWRDFTAAETAAEVTALAKGLVAAGVEPGDRVGLLSGNRYEWMLIDFAIWTVGAITVPIYPSASAEQSRMILADSGAVACFVDNASHTAMIDGVRDGLADLRHLWTIDAGAVDALATDGTEVSDDAIAKRRAVVDPRDPATIVYTSGTTGSPKGCVLTHANFFSEVDNIVAGLPELFETATEDTPPSTLLFLPLAHVFGRMVQTCAVRAGVRLGHSTSVSALIDDLRTYRPTFLLAVPYVFEKIHASARKQTTGLKRRIFDAATDTAVAYSESLDRGGPGLGLRLRHRLFEPLVYRKLMDALGGRCARVLSGGGALDVRLLHFYRGIGLEVIEGYGLTETTAAVIANLPGRIRPGTIGGPLPGVSVKLADDGEIMVKGEQVFGRYWNRPEDTAKAFVDGWFATGDLGEFDADGFLRVSGRKKEILVTAGGKNVAPAPMEESVRAHALVAQCMVIGDDRPFVSALVTLDPEEFDAWKAEKGHPAGATVADLADDADLRAAVQSAIDSGNEAVSRAESIRAFTILGEQFTVEEETLTPTLKLRRARILKRYDREVEKLYQGR
ncbi:long-chain fatty acid--CoA ligase [Nocardiopsis gilva YIM 90087]|uniref:Long-chain fatty acid--CoA ligase n=1 Tax=Nocardiopsis gilva YIM 90087 TaxID=1235441 RepID=A0A223S5P6_9ACTN|nr:long-chain fatty acid--CoA ligase [Nocardiopsis gilva]ASU83443.1 long-chain fatty acid--CoA ligase [Nocardiopsis gilva YIM 90087]